MPYHTRSHGVDVQALQRGIAKASALASAAGMDVIYLISTLANADGDALVALIGERAAKAFKRSRQTTINGVRFQNTACISTKVFSVRPCLHMPLPYNRLKTPL